jgi:hypothetical protein
MHDSTDPQVSAAVPPERIHHPAASTILTAATAAAIRPRHVARNPRSQASADSAAGFNRAASPAAGRVDSCRGFSAILGSGGGVLTAGPGPGSGAAALPAGSGIPCASCSGPDDEFSNADSITSVGRFARTGAGVSSITIVGWADRGTASPTPAPLSVRTASSGRAFSKARSNSPALRKRSKPRCRRSSKPARRRRIRPVRA